MKYYYPIINCEGVSINEIEIDDTNEFRMLDFLYEKLDCSMVEKVSFNHKYDYIIDEEGLLKNPKFSFCLPKYPIREYRENPFVGKTTIVKHEDGEWELFKDYNELMDLLIKYFPSLKIYELKQPIL